MRGSENRLEWGCKFVHKLWAILENCEFQGVLGWDSSGSTFQIRDPKALETQVLPLFFRHCKLKSFVRQLNMYNFRKVRNCRELLVFHNPHFTRSGQNQLHLIRRKLPARHPRSLSPSPPRELSSPLADSDSQTSSHQHSSPSAQEPQKPRYLVDSSQWQLKSTCHLKEAPPNAMPLVAAHSFADVSERQEVGEREEDWESECESVSIQVGLDKGGSSLTGGWGSSSWEQFI